MLQKMITMLAGGLSFFGGFWLVTGLISLGSSIHESGGQGDGAGLRMSIGKIVGGALIMAAAGFLLTLDLSWANS